jgi:exodeoxyribonuclease-5
VGTPLSPALDAGFITRQYNIECNECELTEVVRQEAGSGILNNATLLRKQISNTTCNFPFFNLSGCKDIRSINGSELEDCLYTEYSRFGMREVMVINRSNKNANLYNLQIRARILQLEGELQAGELLMIVRNNYFWLPENNSTSFIANGDILEVMKVNREIELHGFRFAHIRARLCDYDEIPEFETIIMLDTLHLDSPALDNARSKALYESVAQDYLDVKSNAARIKKIHQDPYLNALQVKYAYAVTCHKAQGGQWPAVFVDQGYLSDQIVQSDYLRWLYTAVTRATDTLYLVNFHKKLLEKN